MKVTAFTDKVRFAAKDVIGEKLDDATNYALKTLALARTPEDREAAKKALDAALTDPVKAGLKRFGAESLNSVIEVRVDLGSFLYDCYLTSSIQPKAPLQIAMFNRRLQAIAARYTKEDAFEIEAEELAVIRKTLDSESVWESAKFAAYVVAPGKKDKDSEEPPTRVDLTLIAQGVMFYGRLMEAATSLFDQPVEGDEVAADHVADEVAARPAGELRALVEEAGNGSAAQ